MKKLHCLALVLSAGIFFSSCDKSVFPTGSGAPGNIHGRVTLYDTLTDPFTPTGAARIYDASGVQVTVEGTSYSTVTDSMGQWQLNNIPSGTYPSIEFSKAGFAKQKATNLDSNVGFTIVNNGIETVNTNLFRISLISCNIVLRSFEDYTKIIYRDTIRIVNGSPAYTTAIDSLFIPNGAATLSSRILDPLQSYFYDNIVLYFGTNSHIDALDGSTFLYSALGQPNNITGIADIIIEKTALIDVGFRSGQTIYCIAYCGGLFTSNFSFSGNVTANSEYEDLATGMTIYSGLSPNHSEVKSFVLPP